MTERAARARRKVQSRRPVSPAVVWPSSFRVSERGFELLCRANADVRLEREADGKVVVLAPVGLEGSGQNGLAAWKSTGLGVG